MTNDTKYDYERFYEYRTLLEDLVGGSARWYAINDAAPHPLWMLVFDDTPEVGSLTAFTFGISSVKHPDWVHGCPEIVITVESKNDDWAISLGAVASSLRGDCPFSLGNSLNFGKPLTDSTRMSRYLLFWPTILDRTQSQILMSDRTINFVQAYPIYDSEAEIIGIIGAEKFFLTPNLEFSEVERQAFVG
jgi:hypothetical protein